MKHHWCQKWHRITIVYAMNRFAVVGQLFWACGRDGSSTHPTMSGFNPILIIQAPPLHAH